MTDLAKRVGALLTERWLWRAGMRVNGSRGVEAEWAGRGVLAWHSPHSSQTTTALMRRPPAVDLEDPATQGCLLALLRARGDGTLTTMKGESYASHFAPRQGRGAKGMEWRAATPGEAIARAFLAVYGGSDAI